MSSFHNFVYGLIHLLSPKLVITLICFYTNNLACISGFTKSCETHKILGAFVKFRTATLSFVFSARRSVRPHGKSRLPLDGFSLDFIFEDFFLNISSNWENLTIIVCSLHADLCTFVIISRLIRLRMWNVTDRSCREYQKTHFVFRPASWSSGQSFWLLIIEVPGSIPGSTVGIFFEGEDSRGDHGVGRLVDFSLKAPPGTTSSSITTHTPSGQRNCASWASQPQKSVTLLSCPGGRTTKSTKGHVMALEGGRHCTRFGNPVLYCLHRLFLGGGSK